MNFYINVARTIAIGTGTAVIAAEITSAAIKAKKTGRRVVTVVADDIRNLAQAFQGR